MRMLCTILGAIALLAFWNGCSRQQEPEPGSAISGAARSKNPPTQLNTLTEEVKLRGVPVGNIVFLNSVKLEPTPAKDAVFSIDSEGERLLVALRPGTDLPSTAGHRFQLRGRIEQLPSPAAMQKRWKLSKEQIAEARAQRFYLVADYLAPESQPTPIALSE
ncbi:MAG: hypothetical protein AB7O65_13750 [Candidatus Korobacteraceae bacterium]